jgi:hypothetical protein
VIFAMADSVACYFVDVFASRPLTGNPLSLVPDADGLAASQMRAIAREFKPVRDDVPASRGPRVRRGVTTRPGGTKAQALAGLSDGEAMTTGEVAAAPGLARGTVSMTLNQAGEERRSAPGQRGYMLMRTAATRGTTVAPPAG